MFREPLSAVTVCVGYGDFLAVVAPLNAPHFDKWTVVTSPDDRETQAVCRRHRLHCLVSKDAARDGSFGKGRLVERGLQHLPADGWVMHLDADVILPGRTRDILARSHLEPDKVYGCDRFMVRGEAAVHALLRSGWPHEPEACHPHAVNAPAGFEIGARWAGNDGWVPIGFLQLWHRLGGGEERGGWRAKPYPIGHGTACREDVQFALQWDRRDRVLIPELIVAHVETGGGGKGANWKGRTTPRLNPLPGRRPHGPGCPS